MLSSRSRVLLFFFRWPCVLLAPVFLSPASLAALDAGRTGPNRADVSGVRVPFIGNSGQTDPAVAYYAQTFAGTVFVTRDSQIVYSLPGRPKESRVVSFPPGKLRDEDSARSKTSAGWTMTETAVRPVRERPRPVGEERSEGRVSYFIGNDPSRWKNDLATYQAVSLGRVWPGVEVSLRAYGKNVEKLFTLQPGANASRIRMRVKGAQSLAVGDSGALVAFTNFGDVTFTPPAAYQEREGARREVPAAYVIRGNTYGFRLGHYDPALPVIIDPLLQATFLGGTKDDSAWAVAIHPASGDVYVTGYTLSLNFPGTAGGAQPANAEGNYDAFVARLNPGLTTLMQATYLGGRGNDFGYGIAIHPTTGDVYVSGATLSTDFPGTAGGAQATHGADGGGFDAFVARLNASLTTLIQATYLGGNARDFSLGLAVHPTSGDVYVVGRTVSRDFPGTAGADFPVGSGENLFLARLNSPLTAIVQATYVGGAGGSSAVYGPPAIHPTTGDVYVAGLTSSPGLPGTFGSAQPAIGGNLDAFVGRLNPALTSVQATYLGGSLDDWPWAIAIHPTTGDVYVVGQTQSTNFPGAAGGAQASYGGGQLDAFVARFNASLTTLRATYLGGSGDETAFALAIHPTTGDVYVAGQTSSTNFPGTAGGAQASNGGQIDAFLARLNGSLTTLSQASYLGGSGIDLIQTLAIHPASGNVYAGGQTTSTNFPGTAGGAQASYGGNNDGFVARLSADLAAVAPPSTTLNLNSGRFQVRTQWTTRDGRTGAGQAVQLTADTGYFWFFSDTNVEMVVKVLNACGFNSRFWTFAGGLTDVNVVMTVTDTQTGTVKTYTNPQGTAFQPIQDTSAFATCPEIVPGGAEAAASWAAKEKPRGVERPVPEWEVSSAEAGSAAAAPCSANATALCLNGGRFKVEARWTTRDGQTGAGQAIALTADTGYFWFFSASNVEMVVKVLNACGFNSRFWTFAGGLTDVNVVLTVTDTQTGTVKTYTNPQGTAFQPIQDTSAFATCP